MFLKSLYILRDDLVIRGITFRKGINLIVDETKKTKIQESGNNVGKTTVLRLIDFCLGGKGENIYRDQEFKEQENVEVKNFLTQNNIIIQLTLKENLEVDASKEIIIRRNFLFYSHKIQEINGEKYSNEEFPKKLKELVFKSTKEKPTFKQVIAKNIRDEKNRLVNTLRVLNPYTTDDEYEALFLFWLGIDLDFAARKQELLLQVNSENKLKRRLERENSIPQLNQFLAVLSRNILELEARKEKFNLNESYEAELEKLNAIKLKLNSQLNNISRLEVRRELILESQSELESDLANIDIEKVRDLYDRAKVLTLLDIFIKP